MRRRRGQSNPAPSGLLARLGRGRMLVPSSGSRPLARPNARRIDLSARFLRWRLLLALSTYLRSFGHRQISRNSRLTQVLTQSSEARASPAASPPPTGVFQSRWAARDGVRGFSPVARRAGWLVDRAVPDYRE